MKLGWRVAFALGALLLFYLVQHPEILSIFNPGHVPYFK